MSSPFSEKFIVATCDPTKEIHGKRIIEVGSAYYQWESIQPSFNGCQEFVSVDLVQRYNTTHILNAEQLVDYFGPSSFDFLVSIFLLEHVEDWKKVVSQFKQVLKLGGVLIVVVPTIGCPYHSDYDAWRFELNDLFNIFGDLNIQYAAVEVKSHWHFNFLKAIKPNDFKEKDLTEYKLYNLNVNQKV